MTDKYEEMNKAERRAKRILKNNNYMYRPLKCCVICKKSSSGYPGEGRTCDEAQQEGWTFGDVDDLGICDKYKEIEEY